MVDNDIAVKAKKLIATAASACEQKE